MRTHLRESMLALLLIGILATGCDTGTKKASENSITFDSISVEKTYHLLDNPDNPNCNLEIKFVYPRKYSDKEVLKNLQRHFWAGWTRTVPGRLVCRQACMWWCRKLLPDRCTDELKMRKGQCAGAPVHCLFCVSAGKIRWDFQK